MAKIKQLSEISMHVFNKIMTKNPHGLHTDEREEAEESMND